MTEAPDTVAEYSLRIVWSLARWIEETKGRGALEAVAKEAGVKAEDFDGSTRWVTHAQFEKILSRAHALAGGDAGFEEACTYRFRESYGALRYMIWALTPKQLYEAVAKVSKMVTKAGSFEVLRSSRTSFALRYRSTRAESRLMCLSRVAQWRLGPAMWGLPPAKITERSCIAHGDECCEYELRWLVPLRVLPAIGGFLLGAALAAVAYARGERSLALVALPLLGASIAQILELRRAQKVNLRVAGEMEETLRDLGQSEAETRAEIAALEERQREWTQLMEQSVTERTNALEHVVGSLEELQKSRILRLRGFSHDLRNPLFVLKGNTQFLCEVVKAKDQAEALSDMDIAIGQMELMLQELMDVAGKDTGLVKMAPKLIKVPPLADTFRRRLRALVFGRDIKVTVFCTREAPDDINIDPVVFDRVVDNLLTNAAKYTQSGSIVLEITGTPGASLVGGGAGGDFLTMKLSDTGRGIAPEQVERVFRPRPASEPSTPQSYGIGLSSAVRLLGQIGGRIDVMSKPNVGTTFWAHLPLRAPSQSVIGADDNFESVVMRVVTIRKVENS